MTILGAVLAGGESRRMGSDKALVGLGGQPLVAWAVGRLRPQCRAVAVSRHDGRLDAIDLGVPLLRDGTADRAGPLAGLLAALDWAAAEPGASHLVTAAVDTPFLPEDFVERLAAARPGARAAVAASAGRRHPVAALWRLDLRPVLQEAVAGGLRRVGAFLDGVGAIEAEWPAEPFDPFLNLNGPADLAAAEAARARYGLEPWGGRPCKSPT